MKTETRIPFGDRDRTGPLSPEFLRAAEAMSRAAREIKGARA